METSRQQPAPERPSSDDDAPQVVVRSGGRVRAALRCPYCHDQVGRQGALACARRGCGALYHRECWEECARWDGCAALGCGSREAREVSALGYLVRLMRLAFAALLFPRRVVRALRTTEGAGAVSIFRRALSVAWVLVPSRDPSKNGPGKLLLHFLSVVPALYVVFKLCDRGGLEAVPLFLAVLCLYVGLTVFAPFLVALAGTTAFYALRALALAFRGELAAFGRQDAPVRSERPSPKKDPSG